jgi:hypothetical protein
MKPGAAQTVQPGKKPQMAPPPEAPDLATDVPDKHVSDSGKSGA